jgi:hypothetical protein
MRGKNPVLAGLLNVFLGLGAAYVGEWDRLASGFLVFIPFLFLWIFGVFLVGLLDNVRRLLHFNAGFLGLYRIALFLEGSQAAQIHSRKLQTK